MATKGKCRECGLEGTYGYQFLCYPCEIKLKEEKETLNPDVVLKQIRKEAARVLVYGGNSAFGNDAKSLAQNFQDLDDWLSQEGYHPTAWSFPEPCELCGSKDCEGNCQE